MPTIPRPRPALLRGVLLVLALVLSLLVAAPAHAAGGTLKGTLKGSDGSPLSYFRVDLYQSTGADTWGLAVTRTFGGFGSTLPPGVFEVSGIPAGTYRACFKTAYDNTYEWAESSGIGCWQGAFDIRNGVDVTITDGGTTTITPRLPAESSVHGTVTGPAGVVVPAYVTPYRRAPDGTWEYRQGAHTDLAGAFTITDLDPGTYRFCLSDVAREYVAGCWRDAAAIAGATDLVVRPGAAPSIAFRVARRASISGAVTRPSGSTSSLYVNAYWYRHDRWEAVAYAAVDGDDRYRISGLDADTYRVCVSGDDVVPTCWQQGSGPDDATDVVLAAGQARTGVDLAPGPAGFVAGTLPDMYLGAQGYPVPVAWTERDGQWEAVSSGDAYPTGVGSNWEYRIGQLPTGRYVICVHHEDPEFVPAFPETCNGDSPTPQGGEPVDVVAGQTTGGVDIATDRAGEIRGQVTGTSQQVRVDLYTRSGRVAASRLTDAEGFYRFRDLPQGDYRVGFHRQTASSAFAAEWWRNKTDGAGLAAASPVTVDGDIVTGIRAVLDPGGTVTGRVLDGAGAPVVGCRLQARAPDGTLAVRTTLTGADGSFSLGGLSTASYQLVVPAACTGGPARFYDAGSPGRTSTRVRDADAVAVVLGATTALPGDLQLP
ncbi:carboxypeptidase regulatory-like domain-containing protein [Nocardioides sp. MH1]|uniref:carboxypeptidase regulatory-like domain-containing protein n=1 Tax=Nocardioides sp. MH1 TaxID=3242490 RepID=UPI00351FE01F